MLRIHFVQEWFDLSHVALEDALMTAWRCARVCGHCPGDRHGAGSDHISSVFQPSSQGSRSLPGAKNTACRRKHPVSWYLATLDLGPHFSRDWHGVDTLRHLSRRARQQHQRAHQIGPIARHGAGVQLPCACPTITTGAWPACSITVAISPAQSCGVLSPSGAVLRPLLRGSGQSPRYPADESGSANSSMSVAPRPSDGSKTMVGPAPTHRPQSKSMVLSVPVWASNRCS